MKDSLSVVTPCLLVAVAFPFLFLLAPDGIPVVFAACGPNAVNGTVQNLTVNTCGVCTLTYAQGDQIQINSCSVSKHATKCEIYANLSVTITVDTSSTPNGCDALWRKWCGPTGFPQQCGVDTLAASGAGTQDRKSTRLN